MKWAHCKLAYVDHLVDNAVADPLPEVIALRRLIKDHRDDTVGGGTETLVNRNVGEPAGRERADGRRLVARGRADDLVQRSTVLREESTNGAAKGHAGRGGPGGDSYQSVTGTGTRCCVCSAPDYPDY